MKAKKESYFWASYSDLMTSLFFVMLVLFVLTIALLHKRMVEIEDERKATQAQLDKINEVQKATQNIDAKYFDYRSEYKKHILKISVWFASQSSSLDNISSSTLQELKEAGKSIERFIALNSRDGIQYVLIIEGQSSKDAYSKNYELSYERALALKQFWEENGINLGANCEVLISGSGDGKLSGTGLMREKEESANQRFLIHIVPKYGTIASSEHE